MGGMHRIPVYAFVTGAMFRWEDMVQNVVDLCSL